MELLEAYRRGLHEFTDRVGQVAAGQWAAPTPCGGWDVRTLVNHVVVEDRWTVPMLAGSTVDEVGDRLDGDLLGADPAGAAQAAAARAELALGEPRALDRMVHLSAGDTPAREYLHQLLAEHLVHGWDLAVSIDAEPRLDAEAVRECARWFVDRKRFYRDSGLVDPGVDLPADAGDQDRLIAAFGRNPGWRARG
jgi:uncharacterized protein (TIGR03086 family)